MRQIAATHRGDKSPRLYCCCEKAACAYFVAAISCKNSNQFELYSYDRSQQQISVAATIIFTCHTKRFVGATCRGDVSQRFVA